VRTIKLKVGLHSKKKWPKNSFFVGFFPGCLSFTPTKYRYQHERKKSSEFFLYETETICDAAPHFCLFFPPHDIEETKRLIEKKTIKRGKQEE